MKIIYELDDEKDEYSIQTHKYADESMNALRQLGGYLRGLVKYGDSETADVEELYEKYFEIINDNSLDRDIIGF